MGDDKVSASDDANPVFQALTEGDFIVNDPEFAVTAAGADSASTRSGGTVNVGRFARGRERKVDHFSRYKKAQRVKVERVLVAHQRSKKGDRVSKRDRAKEMRKLKKEYGLNRRQISMIGAGHMEAPWEE